MGAKNTKQKPGKLATAVMAAIFSSGTCAAAMSWGMTKKMNPLLNPRVVLERPISHTGGTRRVEFKRTSGECASCYYRTSPIPGLESCGDCSPTIAKVVPRRVTPQKSTRSAHTLQHTPPCLAIADLQPIAFQFVGTRLLRVGVIGR